MAKQKNSRKHLLQRIQNQVGIIKSLERVHCKPRKHLNHKIHDDACLSILCFEEGSHLWRVGNECVSLLPNDFLILFPKITYSSVDLEFERGSYLKLLIDPNYEYYSSSFCNSAYVKKIGLNHILNYLRPYNPLKIKGFKEGNGLLKKLITELRDRDLAYDARIFSIIEELLIASVRRMNSKGKNTRNFEGSLNTLDKALRENIDYQWTIREMAEMVGCGLTSLTDKMKSTTGFSPFNYLINLRITEATKVLKTTDKSMTDIALSTGFYSSQHFSSTFKKVTGFTPMNYRKKYRQLKSKCKP